MRDDSTGGPGLHRHFVRLPAAPAGCAEDRQKPAETGDNGKSGKNRQNRQNRQKPETDVLERPKRHYGNLCGQRSSFPRWNMIAIRYAAALRKPRARSRSVCSRPFRYSPKLFVNPVSK